MVYFLKESTLFAKKTLQNMYFFYIFSKKAQKSTLSTVGITQAHSYANP
jgi:hypothetical protein